MEAARLTNLPTELIADILSFLDLHTLLHVSQTSKFFATICRDAFLNPWSEPLKTALRTRAGSEGEQQLLKHLGCYSTVPRQNWLHILSLAAPDFILYNDCIPWLPDNIWHQAFLLRFLPSWTRWKRLYSWKRAFLTLLGRIHHRLNVTCTAEESWTTYLILSRHGIVNVNSASSRQYNPHAVLNIYKDQNNLTQPSTTRLIVQLADVRIIAIGTLGSQSSWQVNRLAKEFMHPAGVYPKGLAPLFHSQVEGPERLSTSSESATCSHAHLPVTTGPPMMRSMTLDPTFPSQPSSKHSIWKRFRSGTDPDKQIPHYVDIAAPVLRGPSLPSVRPGPPVPTHHPPLIRPQPIDGHRNFPNYTPGGQDLRWPRSYDGTSDECWVGPMLVTALLVPHDDRLSEDGAEEILMRIGGGRNRWASFTAEDLDCIAPWLGEHIEKRMEGMGLGN